MRQDDPTDKAEFFNVHLKGTSTTYVCLQSIEEDLKKVENKISQSQNKDLLTNLWREWKNYN
jgi:hypothetical protein